MQGNDYSRRNFLKKGLWASALAAAVPSIVSAAAPGASKAETAGAAGYDFDRPFPGDEKEVKEKVVLLIGSAHNIALESRVQRLLDGKACVYTPRVNCGNTLDVLRNLQGWLKDYNPDVVHVTTGYEDIRSLYYGTYESMVPREFYRRNVKQIIDIIYGMSDKAVPIWGTITPVQDDWLANDKQKVRDWTFFTDDVDMYNRDAIKLCRKYKVTVNDLNLAMTTSGHEAMLTTNGFELNGKGLTAVAQAMAGRIEHYI